MVAYSDHAPFCGISFNLYIVLWGTSVPDYILYLSKWELSGVRKLFVVTQLVKDGRWGGFSPGLLVPCCLFWLAKPLSLTVMVREDPRLYVPTFLFSPHRVDKGAVGFWGSDTAHLSVP